MGSLTPLDDDQEGQTICRLMRLAAGTGSRLSRAVHAQVAGTLPAAGANTICPSRHLTDRGVLMAVAVLRGPAIIRWDVRAGPRS